MPKLIGIVLIIGYFLGVWKFWTGYQKTNFSRTLPTRIALSALWPILLVVNQDYRKNFQKALKGN